MSRLQTLKEAQKLANGFMRIHGLTDEDEKVELSAIELMAYMAMAYDRGARAARETSPPAARSEA